MKNDLSWRSNVLADALMFFCKLLLNVKIHTVSWKLELKRTLFNPFPCLSQNPRKTFNIHHQTPQRRKTHHKHPEQFINWQMFLFFAKI